MVYWKSNIDRGPKIRDTYIGRYFYRDELKPDKRGGFMHKKMNYYDNDVHKSVYRKGKNWERI